MSHTSSQRSTTETSGDGAVADEGAVDVAKGTTVLDERAPDADTGALPVDGGTLHVHEGAPVADEELNVVDKVIAGAVKKHDTAMTPTVGSDLLCKHDEAENDEKQTADVLVFASSVHTNGIAEASEESDTNEETDDSQEGVKEGMEKEENEVERNEDEKVNEEKDGAPVRARKGITDEFVDDITLDYDEEDDAACYE
ncbi:unnamed protein product [Gongylonema pulchrum]|uniref:Uncharacterized protein n=1 Tax=Gongylonema pulchrum TaxID=637853 RepID=A0A183DT24_9BILA|nr:unnamed protein product [Gongylonema pulchrum]